jgi:uncharacterized delta-60 repeat protein
MAMLRTSARLAPALAAVAAALIAAPAASAALPPSLTPDTSYASSGVVDYDYTSGVSTDSANGAASDLGLDRLYAVGEGTVSGDANIAVIARHANGVLDTSFAGDGTLSLPIGPAGKRDLGAAIAVLPDHRLRVVGATDVSTNSTPNLDIVVAGLNADGSVDTSFGGGDGIVTFPVGTLDDTPTHMAIAPDGRIAITGFTKTASSEDTFVAVRNADGSPAAGFGTAGVAINDFGGGGATNLADRGLGIAWRSGGTGPVALVQVTDGAGIRTASMHAYTAAGTADPSFGTAGSVPITAGGSDTVPTGLISYGGRLWSTGTVKVGGDANAYLARTEANGSGLQTRMFDIRGSVFAASQAVTTQGLDLTVVPGDPDTLVVGGSTTTDKGSEWAAAAFNNLDANLSALQTGDVVIPVSGQGAIVGVSGMANGSVAATGSMLDYSIESGTGTFDSSIGMARLLVDAEKTCDLSLTIPAPLELVFKGLSPASVKLTVTNGGKRACGGAISVPAPYALRVGAAAGPVPTGVLQPGASETLSGTLTYTGKRRPAQDSLTATLASPADVATGDNTAKVHVQFRYCDAELVKLGRDGATAAGTERDYPFTVRNRGTAACTRVYLAVGRGAKRLDRVQKYTIAGGRSVTDQMTIAVNKAPKIGRKLPLRFRVVAPGDVLSSNDSVGSSPKVVRGAHSTARAPKHGGRRFSGRSAPAKGKKTSKSLLRVLHVDVAILRTGGKGCRWVTSAEAGMRSLKAGKHHACTSPLWIRASGTKRWTFNLTRQLPKGHYVLLTRAMQSYGLAENRFSAKRHNRLRFRVR